MFGPLAAFIAEMFPTRVRYTGSSIADQAFSTISAGFTPMIAAGLMAVTAAAVILGAGWISVLAICAIAVVLVPEGRKRELTDI